MYSMYGGSPRRTDAEKDRGIRNKKAEYLKQVLRVIGESNKTASAPELVEEISKVYEAFSEKKKNMERLNTNIMRKCCI